MPQLNEVQLKQQLKSGDFSRVYLFYGAEGYLKQHYAERLAKACVTPGMEGFNFKKYEASDGVPLSEVLEAAETLPAFGGYMCVLARDYALDALNTADKARLEEFLADPPESTVLLFWQDTVEVNAKKSAKWRAVLSEISQCGATVAFDRMDMQTLCKALPAGAAKRGCQLEKTEARYLAETVGNDLNRLLGELEKLCSYKQSGTITKADIDAVATRSLEANVFDLSRALSSGNCARALEILSQLLQEKEKPELILGTLCGVYVDMYRVKLALEAGERAEAPAKFFNYKGKEFRLRNASRDASRYDKRDLRQALDLCTAADRALKSGSTPAPLVLERLLVQLAAIRAGTLQ